MLLLPIGKFRKSVPSNLSARPNSGGSLATSMDVQTTTWAVSRIFSITTLSPRIVGSLPRRPGANFALLRKEIELLTCEPTGVGLDVPA